MFTSRGFRNGESVLAFAGPLRAEEDIDDFTYTIQVDVGLYLGSSGGIDDYVNHCCEPSCLLRSTPPRLELIAARDLDAGEEITFDYATCISTGPTLRVCLCGARNCRKSVGTFWELDEGTQAHFLRLGGVPGYVLASRKERKAARTDPRARRGEALLNRSASEARPRRSSG